MRHVELVASEHPLILRSFKLACIQVNALVEDGVIKHRSPKSSITAGAARAELQSKVARTHEVRVDDLAWRNLRPMLRAVGERGLEPRPLQWAARSPGDFRKESLLYFRAVLKHVCLVKYLES